MSATLDSTSARAARIAHLTGSVAREILAHAQSAHVVSLAGGLPDPTLFPAVRNLPCGWEQYGCSEGEPLLRELLLRQMRELGMAIDLSQILITSGSQQGLDLVAKLWLDPGAAVVLEAPTYLAAIQVFRLFEARLTGVALDADGLDPEALEGAILRERPAFVYLNPTFQNPSGVCLSVERREAVARILDRHQVPLVEDDPYRDLYYDSPPPPPIVTFLERAPWVYLGSLSKTLMPGLRLGFSVASQGEAGDLLKLKQAADLHTNRLGQLMAVEALQDGAARAAHLRHLRSTYGRRRDAMAQALAARFSDVADWSTSGGGMFFWLRLRARGDLRAWLDRALARGVAFLPGDSFFPPDQAHQNCLRLNFTACPEAKLEAAVHRLRETMGPLE